MHRLHFIWVALLLLASAAPATGQLVVRIELLKDEVLLYESIQINVRLRNVSGRSVSLGNQTSPHWIAFLVTDDMGRVVERLGDQSLAEPVLIEPGQTLARRFDLLPFYDLRTLGAYRIQAAIDSGGIRAQSPRVRLAIMGGALVWQQMIGLPAADNETAENRTYSLLTKREGRFNRLYARVMDDERGLVYGTLPLGTYVPVGMPQAQTDGLGHLHVLFRSGSRAFQYRQVAPDGRIVTATAYSDIQSDPELVIYPDGRIEVQGGEQVYPRPAGAEPVIVLEPETPEPPRRSWWQFWK